MLEGDEGEERREDEDWVVGQGLGWEWLFTSSISVINQTHLPPSYIPLPPASIPNSMSPFAIRQQIL